MSSFSRRALLCSMMHTTITLQALCGVRRRRRRPASLQHTDASFHRRSSRHVSGIIVPLRTCCGVGKWRKQPVTLRVSTVAQQQAIHGYSRPSTGFLASFSNASNTALSRNTLASCTLPGHLATQLMKTRSASQIT